MESATNMNYNLQIHLQLNKGKDASFTKIKAALNAQRDLYCDLKYERGHGSQIYYWYHTLLEYHSDSRFKHLFFQV